MANHKGCEFSKGPLCLLKLREKTGVGTGTLRKLSMFIRREPTLARKPRMDEEGLMRKNLPLKYLNRFEDCKDSISMCVAVIADGERGFKLDTAKQVKCAAYRPLPY